MTRPLALFVPRAAFLALALALAACAVNPVSGRPEFTLVSEAKERELGEEESKNVAAEMGLYEDAALTAYVRSVGERLAAVSPRRDVAYSFQIVDIEEPNAFALPGGYVYVSRGLLALTNDEDELAGVLGHEIGHVAARHAVRRVSRAAPWAVVTGLGAAVTGIVSPTLGRVVGGVGGAAGALVLAPYSRGQEHEADQLGQEMAARAGFDPSGLSRLLHTLEREEALHPEGSRPMSFFATHPALPRRVADTEERARELSHGVGKRSAATPASFLRRLDGLPVGVRVKDGVFDGPLFLHPDLGFHVEFPPGWKTGNGRDAVGAAADNGGAAILLELAGPGSDPDAALRAFEQQTKAEVSRDAERMTIGGLPAIHTAAVARSRDRRVAIDLTWIAYGGNVYQVMGLTKPNAYDALRSVFRRTAGSFGPLTDAERAEIRETRIRLVPAKAGETVAALVARSSSAWDANMAAVANGLESADVPGAGRLVKVAVSEPYWQR
jgi:predicted Zn-dependent protease